jgi:hypothetical protein
LGNPISPMSAISFSRSQTKRSSPSCLGSWVYRRDRRAQSFCRFQTVGRFDLFTPVDASGGEACLK